MVKSASIKANRRRSRAVQSTHAKRRLTLEGLEARQLLAANLFPGGAFAADVGVRTVTQARNVGSVPAFVAAESESLGTVGLNDTKATAEFLPLGTGPDDEDTIDVSGSLSLVDFTNRIPEDVDWFRFDLRAGDILDVSVSGGVGEFDVFYQDTLPYQYGDHLFGANVNAAGNSTLTSPYPFKSPLQTAGDAIGATVVPFDGTYYLRVAPDGTSGSYTAGLRVYRPVLESEPIGTEQVLFLDFDGAIYSRSELTALDPVTGLPTTGTARLSPLSSFLESWEILPSDEDRFIDEVVAKVEENFLESLPLNGLNGSFADSGTPGEFGIKILNSRDHADPYGQPNVSRIIIGGTVAESGEDTIGLAASIDIGNFDTEESSIVLLDQIFDLVDPIPRAGGVSRIEQFATFIGNVAAHEAGHFFGAWHQDNSNSRLSLMDQGGDIPAFTEVGPDGIFGTADDEDIDFVYDIYSPAEGVLLGVEDPAVNLAFGLSTGMAGQTITGVVFNDVNANGLAAGDPGLAGVTVFDDVDGDGVLDPTEQSTVSAADGSFSLTVAAGEHTIRAITPTNYVATTATAQSASAGQVEALAFGFNQVRSDITGVKFADLNGNGTREAGEPGIGGVFIYLDLDGDDRPDLGEPRAITAADGTYSINFPGPGTYTIREVVEAGFIQTFPASGEHTVVFDGRALNGNFNFGNLPARDWGDAPEGYPVTAADDGANHGIVTGLTLGTTVDRELDGTNSPNADFDDLNGVPQLDGTILDDEDGVTVVAPLSPGATSALSVTTTNTTGMPAYLQAWMDFNRDGDWSDPGEQIVTNLELGTGTRDVSVSVPAGVATGDVVARFRYSHTRDLAPTGAADSGEVEDHIFTIQATADVVNEDRYTVARNSLANSLDVLSNDFELPGTSLAISRLQTTGTRGVVTIGADSRTVLYTPPNGFVGIDQFRYFVPVPGGGEQSALVTVNVNFQTNVPIAVDDTYEVARGSSNRPLNVLDNDVASINGGLAITSFSQGNQGGRIEMVGGGQSLRYSPAIGFAGTEQFSYSVSDALGQSSTAQVTINVLPDALDDDQVAFSFEIRDPVDNRLLDNVQVGDEFLVSVLVEDVRNEPFQTFEGVGSAFLDMLYNDELVSTIPVNDATNGFPFDVTFGPLFSGATFTLGDAQTPGLLNEIGGTQPFGSGPGGQGQQHTDPTILFTVRMQAVGAGVATFQADPADLAVSETLVLGSDTPVPVEGLRLGGTELLILDSADGQPTKAVDDSYPDGLLPDGTLIQGGSNVALDVLANDLVGPSGRLIQFEIQNSPNPNFGTATINRNGTPDDFSDDFVEYRANAGVNGVDRFTYVIVDADGFRSSAEVSLAVGAAAADDEVFIDFRYVDEAGNPINEINVGDRFGVEVYLDDLRGPQAATTFGVFAGYLDILYDRMLITPTDTLGTRFGFDVVFSPAFEAEGAVGQLTAPGFINEFGAFQNDPEGTTGPLGAEPQLMATLFFRADAAGDLRVVGDKADFSPFQDTLLYEPPERVEPDRIRYDVETIQITMPAGESPMQNGLNPLDVNADGYVSPIDALGVINTLNYMGRAGVAQGESAALPGGMFADVNGDNQITPFDVLKVVNHLNERARASHVNGEAPSTFAAGDAAARSADDVFQSLGNDASGTAMSFDDDGPSASPHVSVVPQVESRQDGQDDDEDDVLSLLADDVSNVWS